MTSLQSHIVQIPRNSHFRAIPSIGVMAPQSSFFTFTATTGVAPRLTNPGPIAIPATGGFTIHPAVQADGAAGVLSSGNGLLKDLGETIVSAGRTFRRVQLIVPTGEIPSTNDLNEMMGGTYTGGDADALAGYIELGLRGIGPAGPFVRAQ
jgi:hypothetical protein